MLAIVQFSSIAEDGRRGLPATRSLRTEQRFGKGTKPLRDRVRSTFQDRRRPTCGRRRTPWSPPSKRRGRGSSSCDAGADVGSVDDDDSAAAVDDEDEGSMGQSTADGKWTLAMAVAAAMALGEDGDEVAEGN